MSMYRLKFILFAMLIAFLATDGMAMDPAEALLNRAKKLSISTPAEDGTTVDALLADLPAKKAETLAKVGSLKFGPGKKTLQALVDERVAPHDDAAEFSRFGLKNNDDKIGAFHRSLQEAKEAGRLSAATVAPYLSSFVTGMLELYGNGVLDSESTIDTDAISKDPVSGLPKILAHLSSLGIQISELIGERARLEKEIEQQEAMRGRKGFPKGSSGSSATLDGEDTGMGLFD